MIQILPDHVVNKIAAGEVVERPASVVKELIENSIDAGATEISIDIEQAGKRLIRITDNGCGMSKEDARSAFLAPCHEQNNGREQTWNPSAPWVSAARRFRASPRYLRCGCLSAMKSASSGALIEIEGGTVKALSDAAAPEGTSIEIAHLFYNTPARLKFLKSPGNGVFAHPDRGITSGHGSSRHSF